MDPTALDRHDDTVGPHVPDEVSTKRLAATERVVLDLRTELAAQESQHQAKTTALSNDLQRYAFIRSELEIENRKSSKQVADLQTELRRIEESHMAQVIELTATLRLTLQHLDECETAKSSLEDRLQNREAQLQQRAERASSFDEALRERVTTLEAHEIEQAKREATLNAIIQERSEACHAVQFELEKLKHQLECERACAIQLQLERETIINDLRQRLDLTQNECFSLSQKLEDVYRDRHLLIDKCLVASGLYAYFEQRDPKLQKDILGTLLDTMELSADDDRRLRQCSRCMREQHEAEVREERARTWGQLANNFVSFLNQESDDALPIAAN